MTFGYGYPSLVPMNLPLHYFSILDQMEKVGSTNILYEENERARVRLLDLFSVPKNQTPKILYRKKEKQEASWLNQAWLSLSLSLNTI